MLRTFQTLAVAVLLAWLTGCVYVSYTPATALANHPLSERKMPAIYVQSNSELFDYRKVFEESGEFQTVTDIAGGQIFGVVVRQYDTLQINSFSKFWLALSASFLFILPTYTEVEQQLRFSLMLNGETVDEYRYSSTQGRLVSLLVLPGKDSSVEAVTRKISQEAVEHYLAHLRESSKAQQAFADYERAMKLYGMN